MVAEREGDSRDDPRLGGRVDVGHMTGWTTSISRGSGLIKLCVGIQFLATATFRHHVFLAARLSGRVTGRLRLSSAKVALPSRTELLRIGEVGFNIWVPIISGGAGFWPATGEVELRCW